MCYGKGKGSFSVSDGWDMWALLKVEAWTGLEVGKEALGPRGKEDLLGRGENKTGVLNLESLASL